MAHRWAGVEAVQRGDPAIVARLPLEEAQIAELIHLCLTTPFDRALVRCVEEGRAPQTCLLQFQDRNGGGLVQLR